VQQPMWDTIEKESRELDSFLKSDKARACLEKHKKLAMDGVPLGSDLWQFECDFDFLCLAMRFGYDKLFGLRLVLEDLEEIK
jgi:hypothetical protein